MRAGIVGLPQAGKTTIFSILTRSAIDPALARGRKAEPNVGVVAVPDERVDFLAGVFHPRKTTFATVEFVDVGGVVRGQERNTMDPVRDVDALVHVVRAFEDPALPHPDGSVDVERDIRNFDAELILTDLASIEKRLERLEKDLRKMKDQKLEKERDFLVVAREWLESERPLREMEIDEDLSRQIRGFAFLSAKPMLYALNVGEDSIGHMDITSTEAASRANTGTVVICGKLEAEMAQLGEDDIGSFLADYGLTESGTVRLVRSTYRLLGLISFLTAGEEECRAWTIRRGTRAQQAAGAIHSDLEKHFIRAEVAAFSDFKELGGFPALREKGLLRLEGKDYIVADGDIVTVRHSG